MALAAALRPGETLPTEALTYPGAKSAARLLGLSIQAVAGDAHGLTPEALEKECASAGTPRVLYCMPTAHNPTVITLTPESRHAIVAIARRHNLGRTAPTLERLRSGHPRQRPGDLHQPHKELHG
uniref:aminotransferase class I/II-fold pyridoxal phosphate-dependent enzyme n=1 Tax=Streptomyces chartreusis TaxID=1969 RepID=UPI003F4988A7